MITTEVTPEYMNMTEIRKKAEALGITPGKMKKAELIRSIQIAEGCTPCFGRSGGQCATSDCCFTQDCLKVSLNKCKQAEVNLRQQSVDLVDANEQLQREIAKFKKVEKFLEQQSVELSVTNKQLQNQISEGEQAENELKEYHDWLGQHLKEQTDELTTTSKQLQCEVTKREQAEEMLAQLQTNLDNTNFVIRKYLEFRKIRPNVFESSTFGLKRVARFFGRILGLLARFFSQ